MNPKRMFSTLTVMVLLAGGTLGVLSAPTEAFAQAVGADATNKMGLRLDVDKRQVTVGESLHLTLEFRRMGSGGSAVLRQPSIATLEHFEVRGTSSSTQVVMDNQQMVEISSTRIVLVATQPGTETIGPAVMVYEDPQKGPQELKSNGVMVTVNEKSKLGLFAKKKPSEDAAPAPPQAQAPASAVPPSAPQDELRDIKPLLMGGIGWFLRVLFWLIVAVLAGWFVYHQVRKWRVQKPKTESAKSDAALLREKYRKLSAAEGESKEYCLALSELLRACLNHRHGFSAQDLTTEEVMAEARKRALSAGDVEKVEKCLTTCDRVLYADGTLTLKDKQNLKSMVGDFVPKGN